MFTNEQAQCDSGEEKLPFKQKPQTPALGRRSHLPLPFLSTCYWDHWDGLQHTPQAGIREKMGRFCSLRPVSNAVSVQLLCTGALVWETAVECFFYRRYNTAGSKSVSKFTHSFNFLSHHFVHFGLWDNKVTSHTKGQLSTLCAIRWVFNVLILCVLAVDLFELSWR